MEKELKNESEKLKNESEELNVYIEKNKNHERCEYKFLGANQKFIFLKNNNDISKEFFGKLTKNSSLFFIIFTTCWCCFTEYDIRLPLILNKETTYEEVINKYVNASGSFHIIRITMEDALELNSKPDIYGCKGAIDYETLIDEYRLSSKKE
jgi:hypothetical protein